jgi:hypothetical protein
MRLLCETQSRSSPDGTLGGVYLRPGIFFLRKNFEVYRRIPPTTKTNPAGFGTQPAETVLEA